MPLEGVQVRYMGLRRANVLAGAVRWGPRASKWTVFGPFRRRRRRRFLFERKFDLDFQVKILLEFWGSIE